MTSRTTVIRGVCIPSLALALIVPASVHADAVPLVETTDSMHARYYSPNLGRFMSVDPVGGSIGSSQSWNRYSYVLNNPISLLDPDGRAVRVFDDLALARIQGTVPSDLRANVVADESGLISAAQINSVSSSNANFNDLAALVNADQMLDVSTASSVITSNGEESAFFYESEKSIEASIAPHVGQDQAEKMITGPNHNLGYTQEPGSAAGNKNLAVVLSNGTGQAAGAPSSQLNKTTAHELFAHALQFIQGKPWLHEDDPNGPINTLAGEIERRTE